MFPDIPDAPRPRGSAMSPADRKALLAFLALALWMALWITTATHVFGPDIFQP